MKLRRKEHEREKRDKEHGGRRKEGEGQRECGK